MWKSDYFGRAFADEEGASSIEYAILASLIAAVVVIAIGALGSTIAQLMSGVDF